MVFENRCEEELQLLVDEFEALVPSHYLVASKIELAEGISKVKLIISNLSYLYN